ncbi:MAG: molybdenum cofactor biosynthesis protein MoaE [bacterium]|nr:molybdenum cofactor biosynthesis protein MoaE [bacterium]
MIKLVYEPINIMEIYEMIDRQGCGSLVTHCGFAREDKSEEGKTSYIEFEPTQETIGELEEIATNIKEQWKVNDIIIIRRMGKVMVKEMILAVAISAKRRKDAFSACMQTIDCLKKYKTIKKKEIFI